MSFTCPDGHRRLHVQLLRCLALAIFVFHLSPVATTTVPCNSTSESVCGWNSLCDQNGVCLCLIGFSSKLGTDCTEDRCQPGLCYTCLDDTRCSRCASVVTFGTGECTGSCEDGAESLVLQGDYTGRVCTLDGDGLSPAHLAIIGFVCGAVVVAMLLCVACWYHQKRQHGHLKIIKTADAYKMNDSLGNNNRANGAPRNGRQQPHIHEIYNEKSKAVWYINQSFQDETNPRSTTSNGGATVGRGEGHRVENERAGQVVKLGVNSVVFDQEFVDKVALLRPFAATFLVFLNQLRRQHRERMADDGQEEVVDSNGPVANQGQPASDGQRAGAEVAREARALSSAMACLTRILFILNKREDSLAPAPADGIQLVDWAFKLLQVKQNQANDSRFRGVHGSNPNTNANRGEFRESQLI